MKLNNLTISKRIGAVIIAVTLIGILSLILLSANKASGIIREQTINQLEDAVDARSVVIDDYIVSIEYDLARYGQSDEVKNALLNPEDPTAQERLQAFTIAFTKVSGDYEGLYTCDLETKMLAHSDPQYTGQYNRKGDAVKQLLDQILVEGKITNRGIMVSPATGQLIIPMYYPIYENGQPIGYVGSGVFAQKFMKEVTTMSISGLENPEYVCINAASKIYLYSEDDSLFNTETEDPAYLDIIEKVHNGGEMIGSYTYTDASGVKSLVVYKFIAERDWLFIVKDAEAEIFSSLQDMIITMIIISVVTILLVALAIILVLVPVGKELGKMEKIIRRISRMELEAVNDLAEFDNRQDECGKIADAIKYQCNTLKQTTADINRILGEMADGNLRVDVNAHEEYYIGDFALVADAIRKINANLISVMTNISDAAFQVRTGSEQVSSGAQSLSQGTIQQTASIEGLAGNIQTIEQTVRVNTDECRNANDLMAKTFAQVSSAIEKVNYLREAMGNINSSFDKINGIIKTIEDIAFQTNILALNAAVEAARAGEAGKGFAVVADEVRNLATKSSDAVSDTAALIEQSGLAVTEGEKTTKQTAEVIETLDEYTRSLRDIVNAIAESGNNQLKMVENINGEINMITDVVQTTSATAEESAATSEELTGQAVTLNELIGKFRL